MGEDADADQEIPKFEYAFVSRYLTILEAMGAKRLVFAVYDNPVKKDYLLQTPYREWIYSVTNSISLSKKIISLRNDRDEQDKMIIKAYDWVRIQSWENVMNVYLSLWEKSF